MHSRRVRANNAVAIPLLIFVALAGCGRSARSKDISPAQEAGHRIAAPDGPYLGFDRNDYPGDAALAGLKRTFSFAGYWLDNPPGETADSWIGKRADLVQQGFGFLLLFNGRLDKQLRSPARAVTLGKSDAAEAVSAALREEFSKGTIIYLDQEEGGRLLPEQSAYLFAWIDEVVSEGFRAGVYCSGIPSIEAPGQTIVTADDIRDHAGNRNVAFFVFNDACPPSPGCARAENPPAPSASGVAFASIWQFAQSPRRPEYARSCSSTYAKDGNCYLAEKSEANSVFLDMDSALSADPSDGGK
jgi:hypothetical protein